MVTCDPRDTDVRFIRYPMLIIEVMSPSTERVDKREKLFANTTMESLEEYVLVAQSAHEATLFRRGNNWRAERVSGAEAQLAFASLELNLPFATVYEGA